MQAHPHILRRILLCRWYYVADCHSKITDPIAFLFLDCSDHYQSMHHLSIIDTHQASVDAEVGLSILLGLLLNMAHIN